MIYLGLAGFFIGGIVVGVMAGLLWAFMAFDANLHTWED